MHRIKMAEAKTSSWVALQNPAFSKLWFATVTSGICVSAHDTAATWMMNSTSHSTLLLSLMSTAATLPFFLFILPAGALADITDHKKMLSAAYIWLAGCARASDPWFAQTPESSCHPRLSVSDRDGVRAQRASLLRCSA